MGTGAGENEEVTDPEGPVSGVSCAGIEEGPDAEGTGNDPIAMPQIGGVG